MLIAGLYDFDAASGGRSPTRGVPGMGIELEVEVLRGASW